jgi:hypothetical protein
MTEEERVILIYVLVEGFNPFMLAANWVSTNPKKMGGFLLRVSATVT